MSPVPPGCGHISKGSESLYQYFCFQKLPFIRLYFQQSAFRSHTHTAGAVADNCRCSRWAHSNVQITFLWLRFDKHLRFATESSDSMLNTSTVISCVCKSKFFTLALYCVAALWDDIPLVRYSLCPTFSSAMLNMHRWLSGGKGGKSAGFFFSAYETNVWHSSEHSSAVGLSVKRRQ